MIAQAPHGFSIDDFYKGIYLFQKWEVFSGHVTEGPKDVAATLDELGVPHDLSGLRVLDIAPWNGFFSFECARRGAAEVVALGPEDPAETGFDRTRDMLRLRTVSYERGSVYSLSPDRFGTFDIVLFLGLINHLRHPLLALDRIFDVAKNRLYVDAPVIDRTAYDRTIDEETRAALTAEDNPANRLPMLYFTAGKETGDDYNWFFPNAAAFRALVQSSGFKVTNHANNGSWAWLAATKTYRNFIVGFEGYNPGVART